MKRTPVIFLLFVALCPLVGRAETSSTQVSAGGATFALVPPSGFIFLNSAKTRIVQKALPVNPDSNRLLSFCVSEQMESEITDSNIPRLARYGSAQTIRQYESTSINSASFEQIREVTAKAAKSAYSNQEKIVTAEIKERFNVDASIKVQPLGRFIDDSRSFSDLIISRNQLGNPPRETIMAATVSMLLLNKRIVLLYLFTELKSDEDTAWLKEATREMIENTIAANQ